MKIHNPKSPIRNRETLYLPPYTVPLFASQPYSLIASKPLALRPAPGAFSYFPHSAFRLPNSFHPTPYTSFLITAGKSPTMPNTHRRVRRPNAGLAS